jgi:hypothetical protein
MKHYAVSSFVSDAAYHWPIAGAVERDDVLRGMRDRSNFTVLSLPCRQPQSLHWQAHARWAVLEIDDSDFAEQDGVVDFRRGVVLFNGPPPEACQFIRGLGLPVPSSLGEVRLGDNWEDVRAGDYGVAIGGWDVTASAGRCGFALAHQGKAIVGECGVAASPFAEVTAGERGYAVTVYGKRATAGDGGLATVNEFGEARAGSGGIAITDLGGTAVAGDHGLAIARWGSAAVAGDQGIAFAWNSGGYDNGTAQAGEGGALVIRWDDRGRDRLAVAHVGENGIKPNTPYRLDERGRFVECGK